MRADRLVNMVLLLRKHGRMSAPALAEELEVSTRTVLRDIDALSVAGIPVYAERGRHGGFALLPGFQTELAGLTQDEAMALLIAGRAGTQTFGLGAALASAMRKVVDALPESSRAPAIEAVQRLLVDPEKDLLSRSVEEDISEDVLSELRRAVFAGNKLRIHYAAAGDQVRTRVVDPIGLVTVRGRGYLLATRNDEDRTYRLSRIKRAEELPQPAERASEVDMRQVWQARSEQLMAATDPTSAVLHVDVDQRAQLIELAHSVEKEELLAEGLLRIELTFHDRRHANWATWRLADHLEVVSPQWLRDDLRNRAQAIAVRNKDRR